MRRSVMCRALMRWSVLLVMGGGLAGCGGCEQDEDNNGNSIAEQGAGDLLVSPGSVAFPQVPIGQERTIDVQLRNISSDPLRIYEIRLEPVDRGSLEDLSLEQVPSGEFVIEGQASRTIQVRYAPETTARGAGQIVLETSDPEFTRASPRVVSVDTLANTPQLEVVPSEVRFARQPVTAPPAFQSITIRNTGSAPLEILEPPAYDGGADFGVANADVLRARNYPVVLEPYDPDAAQQNPRAHELEVEVRYRPLGDGADAGELLIYSNDVAVADPANESRGLTEVPVSANADVPCILVDSVTRNLGQVPVGQSVRDIVRVTNCGSQELVISSVRLNAEGGAADAFALDLGDWDPNQDGDVDSPVRISPGESSAFRVEYMPGEETTHQARVILFSNDPISPELELGLIGRGAIGACPVAAARARVKDSGSSGRPSIGAAPLDYVILDGTSSTDEDGSLPQEPDNWQWEVLEAPNGAAPILREAEEAPDDPRYREVRLLLAGEYRFGLMVRDNQGFLSCNQAEVIVRAVPSEKILVELTWTNPEDPDESDSTGADVDLHLAKMGPGQWFSEPYDVYFRNPGRANGIWNPESPSLDIDDTDGLGPENIQMNNPANCQWYAIGVHYFRQFFGTAYVTVRVYIDGGLVFEKLNVPLTRQDQFWDVARIHWDSRQVITVDEVLPAAPRQQAPTVTAEMSSSGLCSEEELY